MVTLSKKSLRNLAQIRAKNAYAAARDTAFAGKDGGEVVKKIPALIVSDGLLGTLAFALDKGKESGHWAVFEAVLRHLQDGDIADATARDAGGELGTWFDRLADASAEQLRQTTAEVLAYLAFLRRFAKKGKADGGD